jgi:hypothetical protein
LPSHHPNVPLFKIILNMDSSLPMKKKAKGWKHYKSTLKEGGFKALIREAGWKAALGVFLFFLVKGLLWLIIPYLIAKGLWLD